MPWSVPPLYLQPRWSSDNNNQGAALVRVLALYLMYMYLHTSITEAFLISNKLGCKTDLVDVIYKIMYCNIMYHVSIKL